VPHNETAPRSRSHELKRGHYPIVINQTQKRSGAIGCCLMTQLVQANDTPCRAGKRDRRGWQLGFQQSGIDSLTQAATIDGWKPRGAASFITHSAAPSDAAPLLNRVMPRVRGNWMI
jgi:hypothetical protein